MDENQMSRAKQKKPRKQFLQYLGIGCLLFALGVYVGKIYTVEEQKNDTEHSVEKLEMSVISTEPEKLATAPVQANEEQSETEVREEETVEDVKDADEAQETLQEEKEETLPTEWNLRLVNATHPLPVDYEVELGDIGSGHKLDVRAVDDFKAMIQAAKKDGATIYAVSSYRTLKKQIELYHKKIDEYIKKGYSYQDAQKEAATIVAIPGTSEHHLGLAVDLISAEYKKLDEKQEQTKGFQWLEKNSWKYGFILRYPNGKTDITGIIYEPWHFRYVGKEAALEMYRCGETLEEYVGARPVSEELDQP